MTKLTVCRCEACATQFAISREDLLDAGQVVCPVCQEPLATESVDGEEDDEDAGEDSGHESIEDEGDGEEGDGAESDDEEDDEGGVHDDESPNPPRHLRRW